MIIKAKMGSEEHLELIVDHYKAYIKAQSGIWERGWYSNITVKCYKHDLIEELEQHARFVTIEKFKILEIETE